MPLSKYYAYKNLQFFSLFSKASLMPSTVLAAEDAVMSKTSLGSRPFPVKGAHGRRPHPPTHKHIPCGPRRTLRIRKLLPTNPDSCFLSKNQKSRPCRAHSLTPQPSEGARQMPPPSGGTCSWFARVPATPRCPSPSLTDTLETLDWVTLRVSLRCLVEAFYC